MAFVKKKTEFFGWGTLLMISGMLAIVLVPFPVGVLLGLVFMITASRLSIIHVCSECGQRAGRKDLRCRKCGAEFCR